MKRLWMRRAAKVEAKPVKPKRKPKRERNEKDPLRVVEVRRGNGGLETILLRGAERVTLDGDTYTEEYRIDVGDGSRVAPAVYVRLPAGNWRKLTTAQIAEAPDAVSEALADVLERPEMLARGGGSPMRVRVMSRIDGQWRDISEQETAPGGSLDLLEGELQPSVMDRLRAQGMHELDDAARGDLPEVVEGPVRVGDPEDWGESTLDYHPLGLLARKRR